MLIENQGNNSYTVDSKIEIRIVDMGIWVSGTSSHRLALKPFYADSLGAAIDKALGHYKKKSVRQALEAFAAYKAV